MRFHVGAVPEDPQFHPEAEGWCAIREPGPIAIQFYAVPVAAVLVGGVMVVLWAITGQDVFSSLMQDITLDRSLVLLLGIVALFALHELAHALGHPGWGASPQSLIGAWPSKLLLYAHYEGEMSRNRFLLTFAMPLILLTVFPLVVIGLFGRALEPVAAALIGVFAILNAAAASGDAIGLLLVGFQIPGRAVVKNKGWRTYWKPGA